jgi:hypothetical protein
MTWKPQPAAAESPAGDLSRSGPELTPPVRPQASRLINVGRAAVSMEGKEVDIFTMTLGGETIDLLPLRNWGQLDIYKWTVRGKLPGTPAGLEVSSDHVKLAGEVVSVKDPDGRAKLEKLFEEWLALEREGLELAKRKSQAKSLPAEVSRPAEPQAPRFEVELDKRGQVHVRCMQGKEVLASIGLNAPGFQSLVSQGLMRKPHALKVGALHDWVELDGVLYSFEKGNNESSRLAQALNETYAPTSSVGQGKDIVIYENAASSTGFDIQFPATTAGVVEHRRRPLNEESLELLQDAAKCALLQPGLILKLARPSFIFKQKTPDGGERYLDKAPENLVHIVDDDGHEKTIDLSQPVNYLHLGAVELTAVFNHPAINRHGKASAPGARISDGQGKAASTLAAPRAPEPPPVRPLAPPERPSAPADEHQPTTAKSPPVQKEALPGKPEPGRGGTPQPAVREARPLPNLWLKPVLAQPPIRFDWFSCLVYRKIAELVGNSREGKLGGDSCWAVALGDIQAIEDPAFKGVFLAAKGGLGFLNRGHMARFGKGVCFVGTLESGLEGVGVDLQAVGLDSTGRIIFIVNGDYRSKFGVASPAAVQEWTRPLEPEAGIMTVPEILQRPEPLTVVWSVPAQQLDPSDPQAVESLRPQIAASPFGTAASWPALARPNSTQNAEG